MSSIAVFLTNGRSSVDAGAASVMLDAMAFRAADGRSTHVSGPIALGSGLLATARDGLVVAQDGVAVTLDGRIDNRAALSATLDIEVPASDAELIVAAYRRWSTGLSDHLHGDFGFALWDPTNDSLLVVRDALGVRPVYYSAARDELLVASHPAAIAALAPDVVRAIDPDVLAAFVAGEAYPIDRTVHPDLRRLPPGHQLVATRAGITIERWLEWRILPRRGGAERAERFAELLAAAVTARLDTHAGVGALLSGGLDSSSVVSVAQRLANETGAPPIRTYSQLFPDNTADERVFIEAVVAQGGVDPVFQSFTDLAPFDSHPALLDEQFLPFIGPNVATTRRTLDAARGDGIRVLLDGHGGDEAVSHGVRWLFDLAYRGRAIALWRTLRPFAKAQRQSTRRMFLAIVRRYGPWRRFQWLRHAEDDQASVTATHPGEFGDESRTGHLADLTGPFFAQALETLNHLASARGVELRFPLLDRRLIEWCIAAPGSEKFRDGYTRSLLRRGMAGLLPDSIRWRRDKHDFTAHLARGLARADTEAVQRALDDRGGRLRKFVDLPLLREHWQRLRNDPDHPDGLAVQALWRGVLLSRWLERHDAKVELLT